MERIHLTLHGQMLHAKVLEFRHPTTNKIVRFEAPLPEYFQDVLKKLDHDKLQFIK